MISLCLATHCGVLEYACLIIPEHISIDDGNGSLDTGMDHVAGNEYQFLNLIMLSRNATWITT